MVQLKNNTKIAKMSNQLNGRPYYVNSKDKVVDMEVSSPKHTHNIKLKSIINICEGNYFDIYRLQSVSFISAAVTGSQPSKWC